MSVVQSAMFRDQFNSFSAGNHHVRTPSYNNLLKSFATSTNARKPKSVSPSPRSPPGFSLHSKYIKKRSHSDLENNASLYAHEHISAKRAKTAPPSPPSSHEHSFDHGHIPQADSAELVLTDKRKSSSITLPSISDALGSLPPTAPPQQSASILHKSVPPTVSLDYFDTYKPNDENWRYNLLDSINSNKTSASNQTLRSPDARHSVTDTLPPASKKESLGIKLPSISELSSGAVRPQFDSRVSSKALPKLSERKINFPYESNYTYLNKTYMTDIERYPEYLELAQSLIQLSRPLQQPYGSMAPASAPPPVFPSAFEKTPSHSHKNHLPASAYYNHYSFQPTPSFTEKPLAYTTESAPPTGSFSTGKHDSSKTVFTRFHSVESPQTNPHFSFVTPKSSFSESANKVSSSAPESPTARREKERNTLQERKFIPITPPSVKDKTRSELMKSPPRNNQAVVRVCISCGSDQSPCWRPSWSIKEGQLCNSCGLRYKKTSARCLNNECKKIPAKGEWSLMQTKGKVDFPDGERCYGCLECGSKVEVKR